MSEGKDFVDADLRGARFTSCDLSGAVLRGVLVAGMEVDSPWLLEGGDALLVNGVDVAPYVDAELDRMYPGRAGRRATDPAGLRSAWAAVEQAWAATVDEVETMPTGTVDDSVDGEWSFAQTLRHLVMATDVWLRQTVLREPDPLHPLGMPFAEYESDGYDMTVFTTATPTYAEVLEVRRGRMAMVRDYLQAVTTDELAAARTSPWDPAHEETVLSCLHTILEEEWEHLRYARRDLAALEQRRRG